MKRVLLIIESLGSGGAERQICGLAVMLTAAGYQCRLISYANGDFYESYLRENNVDYDFVPSLLDKKTRIFRLVRYLKKYRPTTVVSFLPSVNITCCAARLFYKCNLLVSERNNNTSITKEDWIRFNAYRIADYIVPNSYSQGAFIKNHFSYLSSKVRPIINFVDINKFVPSTRVNDDQRLRIITVARYAKQKNCLLFLDAVKKIKELGLPVFFEWFGSMSYDSEYAESVIRKVGELGLDDYISIKSPIQNIVDEYQKSDVFILPSLFEGYPNVVAEAMSCELPILCSKVFENPYIVEDGVNGFLFDPTSIEEIVDSVIKICSISKEERIAMGKSNRKLCLERNSEEVFIQSYLKLI